MNQHFARWSAEDLAVRQVQIVVLLAGGPLDVPAIQTGLGISKYGMLLNPRKINGKPITKATTYLSDLCRRGLVLRVSAANGMPATSKAPKWKYMLTAAAMDLLAKGEGHAATAVE